ncbi:hypothetical protein IAW_06056 [Bacillus cereus str. Schrouff]|nr:hypothetical protein IAW_06056 [Bacillus cereus str. Schrouff]EOO81408.1 hypothetical protein IGY_05838 [Bacillus cereus K-5975c]
MIYIILLVFSICLLCIVTILFFYYHFYSSPGIKRIKDLEEIKDNYAKGIIGNKRLIIGGSDVLYAFNTSEMNKKLKIPTINYGTNVGMGLGYLLDMAKYNLKKGDQVILCLAYSLYYKKPYDIFAYEYYRMYDQKKLKRFSYKDKVYFFLANMKLNFSYVQKKFEITDCGAYVKIRGTKLERKKEKPLRFPEKFEETHSIRKLQEFRQYCLDNNIDVKLTFPSTLYFSSYTENRYLNELYDYLKLNFNCIGKPESFLVPKGQIYNSLYHVNEIGQNRRTQSLINYLEIQEDINSDVKTDVY